MALVAGSAWAGPTVKQLPVKEVPDTANGAVIDVDAQPPWQPYLARRPDGVADSRFGQQGRVPLERISPRRVVADLQGRYLVVGQTRGPAPKPMVQRFLGNGVLDTAWGEQGASRGDVPEGATVVDAVPLGDGRVLVLGEVERGLPRAAIWILDTSGRFEPQWLLFTETESAEALSIARVDGDTVMIGLKVGRATGGTLDAFIHTVARGSAAVPERLARQAPPQGWSGAPVLLRARDGWRWADLAQSDRPSVRAAGIAAEEEVPQWRWQTGAGEPPVAPEAAPLPAAPHEPGGAVFNPMAAAAPAPEAVATDDRAWYLQVDGADLTLATLSLLLGGYLLVRLFRVATD